MTYCDASTDLRVSRKNSQSHTTARTTMVKSEADTLSISQGERWVQQVSEWVSENRPAVSLIWISIRILLSKWNCKLGLIGGPGWGSC